MTDKKRLELMARCAALVRARIEANRGLYDGRQAPNLQSVIDLASVGEQYLVGVEDQISALERTMFNPEGA